MSDISYNTPDNVNSVFLNVREVGQRLFWVLEDYLPDAPQYRHSERTPWAVAVGPISRDLALDVAYVLQQEPRLRASCGIRNAILIGKENDVRSFDRCCAWVANSIDPTTLELKIAQKLGQNLSGNVVHMDAIIARYRYCNLLSERVEKHQALYLYSGSIRKEARYGRQICKIQ